MALLDFLKRKKDAEKAKEKSTGKPQEKKTEKKPAKASVAKSAKVEEKEEKKPAKGKAKKSGTFSYELIEKPHISEKATMLGEKQKYTFKVASNANKPEIKKSVEGIYGVDVISVNVIKIPRKKRRIGRTEGYRKGYAKAVVTIKPGQKIEIF